MQGLLVVADYIILNVLYILCCMPIVTIGAAQAGLYTGVRVLQDKENDSSCIKAFFRGFYNGFGKVTLVWLVYGAIMAALCYSLITIYLINGGQQNGAFWCNAAALGLLASLQLITVLVHSHFHCTVGQLFRNAAFLFISHPVRAVLAAALVWLPVVVIGLNFPAFVNGTLLWCAGYYSVVFGLNERLMKKVMARIAQDQSEGEAND